MSFNNSITIFKCTVLFIEKYLISIWPKLFLNKTIQKNFLLKMLTIITFTKKSDKNYFYILKKKYVNILFSWDSPPPCPNRNLKKSLVTNKNLKNKLLFLAMTVRPPEIFTFNSQLFANLSLHQFSVKKIIINAYKFYMSILDSKRSVL